MTKYVAEWVRERRRERRADLDRQRGGGGRWALWLRAARKVEHDIDCDAIFDARELVQGVNLQRWPEPLRGRIADVRQELAEIAHEMSGPLWEQYRADEEKHRG